MSTGERTEQKDGARCPLVSIVTPVWNAEADLPAAAASVRGQSCPDLEWIAVDDGSEDGSLPLLRKLAAEDGRIHIYHQKNAGVSAARNTALSHVRGKYLMFLDADDALSEDAVEKAAGRLEETGDDLCLFGWFINENGNSDRFLYSEEELSASFTKLYIDCFMAVYDMGGGYPWNRIWRTDAIRREDGSLIPFDTGLSHYEDKKWILENLDAHPDLPFTFVNEPLYYYRKQTGTLSHPAEVTEQSLANDLLASARLANYVAERHSDLAGAAEKWLAAQAAAVQRILAG